ncbi:hypothetical protein FSP39_020761 [Pinctada imbricata]|uniref:Protoheme IX farnesyltransferase, mitochondrial n=1 Tax=Pinctada imbricata TaxID=66713 RepID=A0AA88XTV0_PINIB|nr:hypothetical protein FSP39_020761 [Pinctada imbricata]
MSDKNPAISKTSEPRTKLKKRKVLHPESNDDKYLLFHKKSKTLLELSKIQDDQDFSVSFIFPRTSEMIHFSARPRDYNSLQQTLQQEKNETNPASQVDSIEDSMWVEMKTDMSKLTDYYLRLSKIRLTGLVVLTSMAGYAMASLPFDFLTFTSATFGTALTSCSANAVNQYFEVPFDSQMNRTKNRVIVKGLISPLHAVTFAGVTGSAGLLILGFGANPLTAGLGAFNLLLYTLVYTPMKRMSIINTWIGSVVGAVPPMMGWAAHTGTLDPGAWLLAAILYAWQFPHFNALSWNLRPDYSRAGYRMTSVVNPALCKRVALRHTVGILGLCSLAPVIDLTTWTFFATSLPLNAYFVYLAWNFYRKGNSNSARKLFRFSLLHIPILVALLLVSKADYTKKQQKKLRIKSIPEEVVR